MSFYFSGNPPTQIELIRFPIILALARRFRFSKHVSTVFSGTHAEADGFIFPVYCRMKGINGPHCCVKSYFDTYFSHHFPQLRELTCSFAIMPFDFNVFSGLLLPAFIQGLLFAILCWYRGRRQERLSDILLGWLLFLNAVKIAYWMLGFAGWYDTHDRFTSFMFYFPFENLVWMGPLLYFYFLSLTNSDFRFKKAHWPHLVLPLSMVLLVLVKFLVDFSVYYPFEPGEEYQFGTKGPLADLTRITPVQFIGYMSFLFYLRKTMLAYRRYLEYVPRHFSFSEGISFRWIRQILYAISGGILIFLLFEILQLVRGVGNSYILDWYAYFGLGFLVYYISIAGYLSPGRLSYQLHFQPEDPPKFEPEVPGPEPETMIDQELKKRLMKFMEENKPYLDPELSLQKLARQLGIQANALSRLINDGTVRNFNDFINVYRVQDMMNMLRSGEQKTQTLLGIAFDCGFNSKATFNRAFKKATGLSPRECIIIEGKERSGPEPG